MPQLFEMLKPEAATAVVRIANGVAVPPAGTWQQTQEHVHEIALEKLAQKHLRPKVVAKWRRAAAPILPVRPMTHASK